jgi:hypothetical protein
LTLRSFPKTEKTDSDWDRTVEYELDSEDERFLISINQKIKTLQPNSGQSQSSIVSSQPISLCKNENQPEKRFLNSLDENTLELIIDYLEKQSFYQVFCS